MRFDLGTTSTTSETISRRCEKLICPKMAKVDLPQDVALSKWLVAEVAGARAGSNRLFQVPD